MSDLTPVHDLSAEASVLGACLLSPRALEDCVDLGLQAADFYRPAHELIWHAVATLLDRRQAVDVITVADHLRQTGDLDRAGGPTALHDLVAGVPSAASATHYAAILRRLASLRQLAEVGTRIAQAGYDPATDPADLYAVATGELGWAGDRLHGPDSSHDLAQAVEEAIDQIEAGIPAHSTGIPYLDEIITGWVPGTLTAMAARPSVGKSAVALQSAMHLATHLREPVGFTSLEMPRPELLQRAFAQLAQVDYGRIRNHRKVALTEAEWRAIARVSGEITESPLHLTDRPYASVQTIRHDIRTFGREIGSPPSVWIIDYLQLIQPADRRLPREQQIAQITRDLKLLAKETGVAVIVLAQLNREGAKEGRRPRITDLRESGAIEQDSDRVILLHRDLTEADDADPDEMIIDVAKNRQGPKGLATVRWDGTKQHVHAPWSPTMSLASVKNRKQGS